KSLLATAEYAAPSFPSPENLPPVKAPKDDPNPEEAKKKLEEARARALSWLTKRDGPPRVSPPEITDERIKALRKAIEERQPEAELVHLAGQVDQAAINKAIDDAEKLAADTDKEWGATVSA